MILGTAFADKQSRKNMTKEAKGITYSVIGIAVLSAIFSPNKKVESIELSVPDYQIEHDINTKIPVEITLSPTDADDKTLTLRGFALVLRHFHITAQNGAKPKPLKFDFAPQSAQKGAKLEPSKFNFAPSDADNRT